MAKDFMQREIEVGATVFYNAALYRVEGFAKNGRVKLNYKIGPKLANSKLRYGDQLLIVPPEDVTFFILSQTSPVDFRS